MFCVYAVNQAFKDEAPRDFDERPGAREARGPRPIGRCPAARPEQDLYEEFTGLAETRLAQTSLNYLETLQITLTYIKIHTLKHKLIS